MKKLASLIAKQEGKKHQASIGDIREILAIMVSMEVEQPGIVSVAILEQAEKVLLRRLAKKRRPAKPTRT